MRPMTPSGTARDSEILPSLYGGRIAPAFSVTWVAEFSSWLIDCPSSSSAFSVVPPVSRMISMMSSS